MRYYLVKNEFVDLYSNDTEFCELPVIDEKELSRLVGEWGNGVYNQVDEIDIDTDTVNDIINAGMYKAAENLMDDAIREQIHAEIAPCSDKEFLTAYMAYHKAKYNENFTI